MVERIQVTTWGVEECTELIDELFDGTEARFAPLHEKIKIRRQHYYNLKEANPKLPPPYTGRSEYQTDALRRTHIQHRARIIANPPVARVTPPRDTQDQRTKATALEAVRNRVYDLVQERLRINFQAALSDGQDIDGLGILHWCKAAHLLPKMPDHEVRDDLPEDEGEAKRYEPEEFEMDGAPGKRYRETDESLQDRDKHAKASAGAPWHIEVVDPITAAFLEDDEGLSVFVVVREVGLLRYNERLKAAGYKAVVSVNKVEKKVKIYTEKPAPNEGQPSANNWGGKVRLATIWNRDECYELVQGAPDGSKTPWELVKSFGHPYEQPPFAFAFGNKMHSPDPVLAFEPVLEGIFRVKPGYDYWMAMNEIHSESIVMPVMWIEQADGTPRLSDDGKPLRLSRDLQDVPVLRPGEKLVKHEFAMNEAFVRLGDIRKAELDAAAPSVGVSEVTGATAPWAILLQEQQQAAEPKQVVMEQVHAIRTMHRNMTLVESKTAEEGGFGQPLWVYRKEKDGRIDRSTVVGIEPKDIPTLEVDVEINPRSQAEVVTRTQLGVELLDKGHITEPEFREDFKGDEDPEERVKAAIAWRAFTEHVQPGVIKQALAEKYSQFVVVGPDVSLVGFDGQQMTPEEVLEMNGRTPIPPPEPVMGGPGGVMGAPMQAAPGGLPPLAVPGAMPQPGMGI